ncbi:MAG: YCF48-related protein [Wenzhouxiangellaceae bacterium]
MRILSPAWIGALVLVTGLGSEGLAQDRAEPQPALKARLADRSLLLDVIQFNGSQPGYVAVGERGHVLLSQDGRRWHQADNVPVRSMLTRLTSFGRRLWAVGHDAAIISSMDGGETWFIQYFNAEGDDLQPSAQGPLLDIVFLTANKGYAVGAYGRFMSTEDGGIHWKVERIGERVVSESIDWLEMARQQGGYETLPDDYDTGLGEDPLALLDRGCYEADECHLNAIVALGSGRMMIAAERGYGYRSVDDGETWEAFRFPYSGSMFGLQAQGDCVLAFGLRGHVQKSCDFGDTWTEVDTQSNQSLFGSDDDDSGTAVIVGAGATRLTVTPDGRTSVVSDRLGSDYVEVVITPEGLILVGENGVRHE